jgi:hypothetical protein
LQTVVEAIVKHQRNRATQSAIEIAEAVGGAEIIMNRIEKNAELRDLLARSLEAVMRPVTRRSGNYSSELSPVPSRTTLQ